MFLFRISFWGAMTASSIAAALLLGGDVATEGSGREGLITASTSEDRGSTVLETLLGKTKCKKLIDTQSQVRTCRGPRSNVSSKSWYHSASSWPSYAKIGTISSSATMHR